MKPSSITCTTLVPSEFQVQDKYPILRSEHDCNYVSNVVLRFQHHLWISHWAYVHAQAFRASCFSARPRIQDVQSRGKAVY